jgi:hypothetical protein
VGVGIAHKIEWRKAGDARRGSDLLQVQQEKHRPKQVEPLGSHDESAEANAGHSFLGGKRHGKMTYKHSVHPGL